MRRPDRAILKTGYAAPDFTYMDLDGRAREAGGLEGQGRAAGLLGMVVRAVRARHARADTPPTKKYKDRGLEILGIEAKDTREKVAAFIAGTPHAVAADAREGNRPDHDRATA